MLKTTRFSILVFSMFFASLASAAEEEKVFSFGVVPQQAASKLAKIWGPILKEVSQKSGFKIKFQTARDIPTFEERLANGDYDIAYMNPYHYTVFSRQPGYEAFGKALDKTIKGIVVVAKDSPVQNVAELDGEKMAFPAPAAFAASVLPRAYFRNEAIDIAPSYVSSHDSVYRAVAKGLFVAGGGVMRTFNTLEPEVRDQLRVLWKTAPYTSHALATHPRISRSDTLKILTAFEELSTYSEGQVLLKSLSWKGVQSADDALWDDVRDLGIDILDALVDG